MISTTNRFDKVIVLESVKNPFFPIRQKTTNTDEVWVRKHCSLRYVWIESDAN